MKKTIYNAKSDAMMALLLGICRGSPSVSAKATTPCKPYPTFYLRYTLLMTFAIETNQLSKRFGDVLAVDSVNLRVKPGEIGFRGLSPHSIVASWALALSSWDCIAIFW